MSDHPFSLALFPPVGHVCSVCASEGNLKFCGGCRTVLYCNSEHQRSHRRKHKEDCAAIQKSLAAFKEADAQLRASSDAFDRSVGRFGGDFRTRSYMAARYNYADALLRVDTVAAIKKALEHFTGMLRLSRKDELRVRDIVPNLLMRLGQDQECYDFIKWWSVALSRNYNLDDLAAPFLDLKGANAVESIDKLDLGSLSFCNLATLTLLKVKLRLDFDAVDNEDDFNPWMGGRGSFPDPYARPVGDLVRKMMNRSNRLDDFDGSDDVVDVAEQIENLEQDYDRLCRVVHEANSYFWALLSSDSEPDRASSSQSSQSSQCPPGSESEAVMAVHHCKAAWDESEDARTMIESITTKFVKVYQGRARAAGLEKKRGGGRVFPSVFQASGSPAHLFSHSDGSQNFVDLHNAKRALVYVDGACSSNGQADPRAGWAVVYGPGRHASGRLETTGPFGDASTATSNRAELRAAIAALRLCDWMYAGFDSLVIATDSSYVATGSTQWTKKWVGNEWKIQDGSAVKNRDLWELLLWEVERWNIMGLKTEMWNIPREDNAEADAAAKDACDRPAMTDFTDAATVVPVRGASEKPRVLGLGLDMKPPLDDSYLSSIAAKTEIKTAGSEEAALLFLAQEQPPPIVVAADGAIFRKKVLMERVIDHVRSGATLVLTGTCVSLAQLSLFNQFFAMMGLPGTFASYDRAKVTLQKSAVGARLAGQLTAEYSLKASFLKNMPKPTMWYVSDEDPGLSPVVLAPVGNGQVGYIGDVTENKATFAAFEAMCGLRG